MRVFSETRHAIDKLSLEEVKHVVGAETDLIIQTDVPAGGATAVDFLIEAEIGDLLVLSVLLHRLQILLGQNRQLFVVQQDIVVYSGQVLNHLDLTRAHRCRLVVVHS